MCVYIYIYMYLSLYMYVYVYVYIYIYKYVYTHVLIYVFLCSYYVSVAPFLSKRGPGRRRRAEVGARPPMCQFCLNIPEHKL